MALEKEHHDRLLMMDREEMLRVCALLSKAPLNSDQKIGDKNYKKGQTADISELEKINRFTLTTLIKAYSKEIQKNTMI